MVGRFDLASTMADEKTNKQKELNRNKSKAKICHSLPVAIAMEAMTKLEKMMILLLLKIPVTTESWQR